MTDQEYGKIQVLLADHVIDAEIVEPQKPQKQEIEQPDWVGLLAEVFGGGKRKH